MRSASSCCSCAVAVALMICFAATARAQSTAVVDFQPPFAAEVQPFLAKYCLDCHGAVEPESMLNLARFDSAKAVTGQLELWKHVLGRLEAREMPPEESTPQPTNEERAAVVKWIREVRADHARRHAGDPGLVLARRLSNAELNYTIHDLTGVDIQPAKDFPVDPANEAGFDNSGESLTVSPSLVTKYLDAARLVADHIVFKPHGFDFAPYPVISDTDRDKYAVNRIIEFYQRQPLDLASYFHAAWEYNVRLSTLDQTTLDELARARRLSAGYLHRIWDLLTLADAVGPIDTIQASFANLPNSLDETVAARVGCEQLRNWIQNLRAKIEVEVTNPRFRGLHEGAQPLALRLNREIAAQRRKANLAVLQVEGAALGENVQADPDLTIPADESEQARHRLAFEQIADVFPDRFLLSERGRIFLRNRRERDEIVESGRLLSAGFHSMMGYFRDDQPLYDLILDDAGRAELDELWRELDFITRAPVRMHQGSIWFDRAEPPQFLLSSEFNHVRAEDANATSEASLENLRELYLAKAINLGAQEWVQEAINVHFHNVNASIRALEAAQSAAVEEHLRDLVEFAARAYRRPLTETESTGLRNYYKSLVDDSKLAHEDAIRDCVASVLASPRFWYRIDLPAPGNESIRPLTGDSLASRLSYFLWASLPDEELSARSADLDNPEVLRTQTRRMLGDPRVRRLAVEFGGNWLDFRRFEEHNSVDRGRFPSFTNSLRQSMFEEPVRFLADAFQNDRPVSELLFADYTFVDSLLAQHYGLDLPQLKSGEWVRVDDAAKYHRGGLLPMAVFQTKNSPGLRTSPVKRGYWVVRRLLGQEIPAPPPNVPDLPSDEKDLGALTLRDALAVHRENPSCAGCHEKFDSFGLVFEGFGPVGEYRALDLGGRPVQTVAEFPDGSEGAGLEGLQNYIKRERQADFIENFCRKLLSYALGRSLIPSDDTLVEEMVVRLGENENRIGAAVETIVLSPQFRNKQDAPQELARQ